MDVVDENVDDRRAEILLALLDEMRSQPNRSRFVGRGEKAVAPTWLCLERLR